MKRMCLAMALSFFAPGCGEAGRPAPPATPPMAPHRIERLEGEAAWAHLLKHARFAADSYDTSYGGGNLRARLVAVVIDDAESTLACYGVASPSMAGEDSRYVVLICPTIVEDGNTLFHFANTRTLGLESVWNGIGKAFPMLLIDTGSPRSPVLVSDVAIGGGTHTVLWRVADGLHPLVDITLRDGAFATTQFHDLDVDLNRLDRPRFGISPDSKREQANLDEQLIEFEFDDDWRPRRLTQLSDGDDELVAGTDIHAPDADHGSSAERE